MRYLAAALISEGKSDDEFLPRLLTRLLEDVGLRECTETVEVADVLRLRHRSRPPTIDEVLSLVDGSAGSFPLVFYHRDQGASPSRVEREWLTPLLARWGSRGERLVPVVPVRETEAWLLADGDALRTAFGVRWSDRELGLPSEPARVEQVADPKAVVNRLGDRVGRGADRYFERLGGLVSLEVLGRVPAFARLRADIIGALTGLGYQRR